MTKLDTYPHFAVHTKGGDPFDTLAFPPDTIAREARMRGISAKKAAEAVASENTDVEADGQPLVTMAWPLDMARKLNEFAATV